MDKNVRVLTRKMIEFFNSNSNNAILQIYTMHAIRENVKRWLLYEKNYGKNPRTAVMALG